MQEFLRWSIENPALATVPLLLIVVLLEILYIRAQ